MLLGLGAFLAAGLGYYLLKKKPTTPVEPPPPPPPADLRIESLVITPASPIPQTTPYLLTATIRNYGETAGDMIVHFGYDMGDANSNVGNPMELEAVTITVPSLGAVTATHAGTTAAYGGAWWMWANDGAGDEKRALLTVAA
jgi:hypothetical protein